MDLPKAAIVNLGAETTFSNDTVPVTVEKNTVAMDNAAANSVPSGRLDVPTVDPSLVINYVIVTDSKNYPPRNGGKPIHGSQEPGGES